MAEARRQASIAAFLRRRARGQEISRQKKVADLRSFAAPSGQPTWNGSTLRSGARKRQEADEAAYYDRVDFRGEAAAAAATATAAALRLEDEYAAMGDSALAPEQLEDVARQLEGSEAQHSRSLAAPGAECGEEVRNRIESIRRSMEERERRALEAARCVRAVKKQLGASPQALPPPPLPPTTTDLSNLSASMPAQQEGLRRRHMIGDIEELVVMAGEGSRSIRKRDEARRYRSSANSTPKQRAREERWASSTQLDQEAEGGMQAQLHRSAPGSITNPSGIDARTGRPYSFQPDTSISSRSLRSARKRDDREREGEYFTMRDEVQRKLEGSARPRSGAGAGAGALALRSSEAWPASPAQRVAPHRASASRTPRSEKLTRSRAAAAQGKGGGTFALLRPPPLVHEAARTRPRNATGAATFDFSNVSKAVARAIERDERANEGKAAEQQALSSANGTPRRAGAMPFETQRMGRSHQKTRHSFRESHAPAGQEQEYRDSHLQHTRTVDWIKSGAF